MAASWMVRLPSLFGAPRLTENVYGPAPLPDETPLVQEDEAPPMVTSLVVESKPVTDSEKVTEQLNVVAFVGVVAGEQVKAVTVGAVASLVTLAEALPVLVPASVTQTRTVFAPAASEPAGIAKLVLAGLLE